MKSLLFFFLILCVGIGFSAATYYLSPFEMALADAQQPNKKKLARRLTAIHPKNKKLIRDEEGRVLMVFLTNWSGYDSEVGKEVILGRPEWATVAPQLQQTCQAFNLQDSLLHPRILQLLGYAPTRTFSRVLEVWVEPADLFRACPDPEITDKQCQLDYPKDVDAAHKKWMKNRTRFEYHPEGRAWTQLGYYYDWNPNTPNQGLSEFVIRRRSKIRIHAIHPLHTYCQNH